MLSRSHPVERIALPLIWGTTGSGCLPVWAADSKRLLIGERGRGKDGASQYSYRVYDLTTKTMTDLTKTIIELNLGTDHSVTGWSADGKRLLATVWLGGQTVRIAWINVAGGGKPDFITSADEVAFNGRLSPDGRRLLCQVGPKPPKGQRSPVQLCVIDLSTKKRTMVDEPGNTHGYCWSPDGSRIAYTWQRLLEKPAEVAQRETLLLTCDRDGGNRKIVTSRKYVVPENSSGRSSVVFFFEIVGWR